MLVYNNDVVQIFNKFADLLDIKGANKFRVRAPYDIDARMV
jgi:DNA polymerase/3'-5' exonuclease PolX